MISVERLSGSRQLDDWENAWSPYDAQTYADALAALDAKDIVLDIGAGDLRFALQAASRVRQIFAIEQRAELLPNALPENLRVACGDARQVEFPQGITAAVLLMRHCQHFKLYCEKLERVGCKKLITNARWGMDVEVIDLTAPRIFYSELVGGWYACGCGAVGYKVELEKISDVLFEVMDCPCCAAA
jgi:hypothetical protein